jgi:hypothetical protein
MPAVVLKTHFDATTLIIATLRITTLTIIGLIAMLSIDDIAHASTAFMMSVGFFAECHYRKCRFA